MKTNILKFFKQEPDLLGLAKLRFWNIFFVIIFTSVVWLCFISMFSATILERIINPIKFASENSVVIEIYPENNKEKSQMKAEIVLEFLKSHPDVLYYEKIEEAKILELINGFTGDIKNNKTISLPIIITASLKNKSTAVNDLRATLSQKVKHVYLDTEAELLKRLSNPISTAKYIAIIIPIIASLILVGILFLMVYTILFSNHLLLKTLILLGTLKNTLSLEFGRWILKKSILSVLFGLLLGVLTALIVYLFDDSSVTLVLHYIPIIICTMIGLPLLSSLLGILFVHKIVNNFFSRS